MTMTLAVIGTLILAEQLSGPYPPAMGTRPEDQPHYCHIMPGENAILLQEHWFFLVAPRPILCAFGSMEAGADLEFLFEP